MRKFGEAVAGTAATVGDWWPQNALANQRLLDHLRRASQHLRQKKEDVEIQLHTMWGSQGPHIAGTPRWGERQRFASSGRVEVLRAAHALTNPRPPLLIFHTLQQKNGANNHSKKKGLSYIRL